MQEKIKYIYDPSLAILYKNYFGPISLEDIKSSWMHAFENDLIPKEIKGFILDYRKAKIEMEVDEHTEIADFYKNNLAIFRNKKIAIISDEPRNIVIIMLVESKNEGYFIKPFTTLEAAKTWVLN